MGGLCTAIGCLKHPNLKVQIYEAAHHFSEIGAGVAFGPNAQRALKLIGQSTEDAYLRQATHNQWQVPLETTHPQDMLCHVLANMKHKLTCTHAFYRKSYANCWFEYRMGMVSCCREATRRTCSVTS